MYLVSDNYGDFKKIMSYKELVEMLIDEIMEDTENNYDDKDIVLANNKQLGKIAKAFRQSRDWLSCKHQTSVSLSQMHVIHNRFYVYGNQTETFSTLTSQAGYNRVS